MKSDDYRCTPCDKVFEHRVEFGADFPDHPPCPECKSTDTKRTFGARTVQVAQGYDHATGTYFAAGATPLKDIPGHVQNPEHFHPGH